MRATKGREDREGTRGHNRDLWSKAAEGRKAGQSLAFGAGLPAFLPGHLPVLTTGLSPCKPELPNRTWTGVRLEGPRDRFHVTPLTYRGTEQGPESTMAGAWASEWNACDSFPGTQAWAGIPSSPLGDCDMLGEGC